MKLKVIKDFETYIIALGIGYQTNYDKILNEISFIQMYTVLDKIDPIYEYLLNN